MSILNNRPDSASGIAREIGEKPSAVAYHVRVLAKDDVIEHVATREVNGGQEKIYRGTESSLLTLEEVQHLDAEANLRARELSVETAYALARRALDEGHITRSDTVVYQNLFTFDDEGWRDVYALVAEFLLENVPRIQDESLARLNADPAARRLRAGLNLQLFEAPPP